MTSMTNKASSLSYRQAATQQASVVGLVIALYDTLIGNLRRAAEAMDKNDIQARCDELIHGFKVLQQLDAMLDMERGGETAAKNRRFYSHLRGQMLTAQFKLSSEILKKQIGLVLEVRQAWQQIDSALPNSDQSKSFPIMATAPPYMPAQGGEPEVRSSFSCSG